MEEQEKTGVNWWPRIGWPLLALFSLYSTGVYLLKRDWAQTLMVGGSTITLADLAVRAWRKPT